MAELYFCHPLPSFVWKWKRFRSLLIILRTGRDTGMSWAALVSNKPHVCSGSQKTHCIVLPEELNKHPMWRYTLCQNYSERFILGMSGDFAFLSNVQLQIPRLESISIRFNHWSRGLTAGFKARGQKCCFHNEHKRIFQLWSWWVRTQQAHM